MCRAVLCAGRRVRAPAHTHKGARDTAACCRWQDSVRTAARPYAFLTFGVRRRCCARICVRVRACVARRTRPIAAADKHLQRLRKEYQDPEKYKGKGKLAGELADIQQIMRRNITEVLNRGEQLESASRACERRVAVLCSFVWSRARALVLMF